MIGKLAIVAMLLTAVVAGGAIYYLQVYAYYVGVPATGPNDVQILALASDLPRPLAHSDFRAIDASSSPIRYRACFTTDVTLDEMRQTYVAAPGMDPRNAPDWFDCFDAAAIGAELEAGTAETYLGAKNIAYGVDRIIAITADGRGYVWHELNNCGTKGYDGTLVGEECPPRPGAGGDG